MAPGWKLDDRLVRAIRRGPSALPADLALLAAYLRLVVGLLEEKAVEMEPDWSEACIGAAEIETLQNLEAALAERAVEVQAADLEEVRFKFEIWRALAASAPDGDLSLAHNRLILSIESDIQRLQRAQRR